MLLFSLAVTIFRNFSFNCACSKIFRITERPAKNTFGKTNGVPNNYISSSIARELRS